MEKTISRREAREAAFLLLFETEFRQDEEREDILTLARESRDLADDAYVRRVYFGVAEHLEQIDALITKHAKGWKVSRISKISRSIMRLSVFEMLYCGDDVPHSVSINEAVELCKTYDAEEARAFLNGVLNGVKNEIEAANG